MPEEKFQKFRLFRRGRGPYKAELRLADGKSEIVDTERSVVAQARGVAAQRWSKFARANGQLVAIGAAARRGGVPIPMEAPLVNGQRREALISALGKVLSAVDGLDEADRDRVFQLAKTVGVV